MTSPLVRRLGRLESTRPPAPIPWHLPCEEWTIDDLVTLAGGTADASCVDDDLFRARAVELLDGLAALPDADDAERADIAALRARIMSRAPAAPTPVKPDRPAAPLWHDRPDWRGQPVVG